MDCLVCFERCLNRVSPENHPKRQEIEFYNSSTADRTLFGHWHYCCSCPGWNKVTSRRVAYSRWEWGKLPYYCCFSCCGYQCATGRALDTFPTELVTDVSAHQTMCQICRNEGDMVLYRLAGGDVSNSDPEFNVTDVSHIFDVFNSVTFELSKVNLKSAAAKGLGKRMGAVVWDHDARSGALGPVEMKRDMNTERIIYDSQTANRSILGHCMQQLCPPIYKITSERVLYVQWDLWYLCDDPVDACFCPYYAVRAGFYDACACFKRDTKSYAEWRAKNKKEKHSCEWCVLPIGRTADYFDMDIVVDVGAHQRCMQLCLNEGDFYLYRLVGGDQNNPEAKFTVYDVPEVFNFFDSTSYELSLMELSHFRQNSMATKMTRT